MGYHSIAVTDYLCGRKSMDKSIDKSIDKGTDQGIID